MPNNDKVEKLYKTFVSEGYEMEPIDEFRKNLSDKNKRKAAYDALVKDGYDMEPYAEFEKNIGFGSVVAASVVNPTETTQPKAGEQPTPAEASGPVARMKELVAQNGTAIPQQPTLQMKVDAVNEETRRKKAEKENPPVIDYAGMMRSEQINMAPQRMEPVRMDVERKQEEQNLGTMFYPKEVKSEADVLDNYRARFSMTKRGNELNNELDAKGREVNERYMKEFEQTPEYKEIVGRKYRTKEEADEANQLLNDTFGRMYGKQIEQEMAPYYLAMQEEINDRYGFRIGEDVKALRKQTTSEQVKELATDVDGLIEKQRKSMRRHAGSGGNAMNALMGSAQYMQATTEERKEMGALDAAKKLLEQSQNIIEAAGRRGDTNFMKELGIGVADNFDLENFTFGLAEMAGEKYLNNALEKADKGEALTAAEEKLLEASFINMATQTYFGSDLARGYKAGQVTAESLPFMMEFIVNPISASGNAIAKSLLKFGLKRFGNVATRKASKFAGRLLGDAAAALGMEATTGVPRVAAGTLQRLNEDYDYSLDENGDIQVKKAGDVSLAGALGRSAASTFIENQSEMIFNAFKGWKPFMKAADDALPGGVNELMARIKRSKPAQLYRSLKDNKLFRDAVERAQFHGIGEEYLEEVYNNLSNVAMGEMTMNEALDLDNNIDTFLGLAPTSAAFGLIGLGGLAHERIRNRRNMERIFGRMNDEERSKLEELQRMAGERGNEDIREFIKETMADESLTQGQKRDEIAYAYELAKQTAMNEMEEAQAEDAAEASPEAAQAYAERKDAEERLKEENPQMYAMLKRYLESDASDSEIEQVLMDVGSQGGLRDLGQAYVDAYRRTKMAVRDVEESEKAQDAAAQTTGAQAAEPISVQNRITAYREEARRKAESDVQMLGNEDMGEVIEVETALGDGKTVFVTKGRLVFNEDGLVDPLESDDTIYYRDSDGNVHPTKPNMLTKLVNRTGFGEYVATAEYQAAERAMAEAEAENDAQPAEDAGMQPDGKEGTAAKPAAEPAAEKPVPRLEDGTVDYDSMLRDDPMAFYREYAKEFGTEEANNALAAQRDDFYKQATQKEKQAAKEVSPGKRATLLREAKRLREEGKRFENMVAGWKQKEPKATQNAVPAEEQTASEAKPQGLIAEAEAEVQRQQKAISGRTEEEQQAAQQAAQARIDAGVKATPKTRRYGEEESKLPPASTLRETVAREIATGRATFRWKDNGATKGLGAHTTNNEEERRRLIWALNNTEGELPEVVAERIHESLPDGMREQYTSMDVLNEILDLMQTYSSPTDMWAQEVRRPNAAMNDETLADGYAENDDRLRLEWEAEKNGMSVEEWQSYNEAVGSRLQESYGGMTDEEFNRMYNDIVNETESEYGQQGTERGGAVLPEQGNTPQGGAATMQDTPGADGAADAGTGMDGVSGGIRSVGENRSYQEEKNEPTEEVIGRSLTDSEAQEFIADMELSAENAPEIELTIENWDRLFGEDGNVTTPIGEVKMGEHQFTKMMRNGRNSKLGMIKPTLERPDVIIEVENTRDNEERDSSYVFVRSFKKIDGSRYYYFTSVTVSKEGKEVVVSNQEKSRNRLARLLKEGSIVWRTPKDATTSSAEGQGLDYVQPTKAETDTKGSGITPHTTSSAYKDTAIPAEMQENSGEKQPITTNNVQKQVEDARTQVNQYPTDAQKEAGNYRKGHVRIDGYDISIENPKGSVRSGVDAGGKAWSVTMNNDYGYIRGTKAVDGDHIDVFLSENPEEGSVFVIDQLNEQGEFDESKVMYGFNSLEEAKNAYLANYSEGWEDRVGAITEVSKEDFKRWIGSSTRKTKPFSEYKNVKQTTHQPAAPKNASGNRLVTDERYAELRERMRRKLGGQMNMGIDPEILAIGTEMAVYHIEKGARKFMEYAKGMIADMGDAIRPYLKAFYNGARDLPEMAELAKEMTPYDEVARTDVSAIGKKDASYIEQASQMAREQEVNEQAETAKKAIEKKKQELSDSGWDVELVASSLPEDQEMLRSSRKKQPAKKKSVPVGDLFAQIEEPKDASKSLLDAVRMLYSKGKEAASAMFQRSFFDVAQTPEFMKKLGLRGDKFTIKYGVISRHIGKDSSHNLSESDWEKLPDAIQHPFAIARLTDKEDSYRIYTALNTSNGGYAVVGADVKNAGREIEVNAISTVFGRRGNANLPQNEEVIYRSEKITPEQSSLLERPNFAQYPIDQESKRQAEHEDGQLLILPSESSEEVGALSDPMLSMSSADKGSKSAAKKQAEELKNEFFVEDRDGGVALMRQTVMSNGVPVVDARPVARAVDARELLEIINNPANRFGKELDNVRKALAVEIAAMREKPAEKQKESGAESEGKDVSLPKQNQKTENNGERERTEERDPNQDGALGEGARQEDSRPSGRGTGRVLHGRDVPDQGRGDRVHVGRVQRLNPHNHSFGEAGIPVPTGEVAKLKANIEAIRTLKEIERSGLPATKEQKEVLSRYVGWGGLSAALDGNKFENSQSWRRDENWNAKYLPYHKELRELLTREEMDAAVQSTNTAHYTPEPVIRALWSIVEGLGFRGGRISEPALGVGHILGLMPEGISANSVLSGFELDSLTGRIVKALYPDANVKVQGYETEFAPQSKDLVITNVPFGKQAPYDKALDKSVRKRLGGSYNLHNYFIAKGLLELKEGGLGVFVTSSATMDGADNRFRSFVEAESVDLLGAIRLPNDAFLKNAGTSVTADILVFRKRKPGEQPAGNSFLGLEQVGEGSYEEYGEKRTKPILVNEYFATHPEMMLGEMMTAHDAGSGGLYSGASQTLKARAGSDLQALLADAVKRLTEGRSQTATTVTEDVRSVQRTELKDGTLTVQDGKVYVADKGELTEVKAKEEFTCNGKKRRTADAVRDYNELKETLKRLIAAEQSETEDPEPLRRLLNDQYDRFVAQYGTLNRNKQLGDVLAEDYEHSLPYSLESVKRVPSATGKSLVWEVKKGDGILSKRISYPVKEPTQAESVEDALQISLSYRGRIDLPYISSLLGVEEQKAEDLLLDDGMAFRDPVSGKLTDRDEYLSGNVKEKLDEAVAAAETNPEYHRNVEELKKAQPEPIRFGDISYRLGTPWIPTEYVDAFAREVLGVSGTDIRLIPELNEFVVSQSARARDFDKSAKMSTSRMGVVDIFAAALNQRKPKIYDERTYYDGFESKKTRVVNEQETQAVAEKIAEMGNLFLEYIDGKGAFHREMERIYNEKYNNYRLKEYRLPVFAKPEQNEKGETVMKTRYPNANVGIALREHQAKAVQRSLQGCTLLAHQVGTGKTFTMITTAMEMRRLGLAKRPMIVVQNATLEGFVADFYKLYPGARVLAPGKDERSAENRKRLFNLMATSDFDAIVIPQSFMQFIPDNEERKKALIQKRIDEYEAAIEKMEDYALKRRLQKEADALRKSLEDGDSKPGKGRSVKERAKSADRIKARMERTLDRRTDDVMTFEQLGVDALFIDEAHNFKKIGFASKMNNVKGIDTSASQRANSLLLKAQWVYEKSGGRNVVLATGTPITNTMAEVWTMMKFVAPDILESYHIESFDDFATTFGTVEPSLEYTATGAFKIVERFKSYVNVPELVKAFRSHADVVLTEDVKEFQEGKNIPKLKDGKMTNVVIEKNEDLEDVMQMLIKELEAYNQLTGQEKRDKSALPLVVFTRAKQAAIDLRLLNPAYPDNPNSKTNHVVRNVLRLYEESRAEKGAQLVFCDSYQSPDVAPKMDLFGFDASVPQFNLYNDIKQKLVAGGIPSSEIAIVSNYSGERREQLFEKVRNGEVRVLLGSTEKMGVGVNVQDRLYALHHIDAPIRPMDFEQRNGRILRQGNLYATWGKPVNVVTYGVSGTLDATAYDRLRMKQGFINQMMKGNVDGRVMEEKDEEDPSGMTFSEMAATLSGDKNAQLLFVAENKVKKLRNLKRSDANSKSEMRYRVETMRSLIPVKRKEIERLQRIADAMGESVKQGVESVSVGGETFTEKLTASLSPLVDGWEERYLLDRTTPPLKLTLNGGVAEAVLRFDGGNAVYDLYVGKEKLVENKSYAGAKGVLSSMDHAMKSVEKNLQEAKDSLSDMESRISGLEKAMQEPWGKEDELRAAEEEVKKLKAVMEEQAKQNEKSPAVREPMPSDEESDNVRFRLREEEAPKKTGIGYKVFVLKGGRLYPPMVANPNGADTPVGVWLDADAAPVAGESKTGRKQVKAGGKGTQGGSGQLAYRPGWHLGEIPYALQFNRKNPLTGEKELFPKDFVWAEVEYAADVDYQEKAMSYGYNANGKFQHSLAGLPELPVNGAYKYRTNPNPETDPWIITGAMKVKRLLKPSEVDELVSEAGREPQTRQEGAVTDAQIEELNGLLLADGLEEVNRRFNERLEELMRDPNQKERTLHLGTPGRFLTDGGIANAEILLDFDKLVRKSREEYRNNHPFAVSDVRDLPVSINSPIAVFDNTNGKDSGRVILTELKKDGRNFIVAIRATEQKRKGGVVLEVNEITTLYPKEERGIVKWIIDGNATNIDKQKALRFIEALQPHVGTTITSEELSDATKIIENFENPKLEGKKMRDGEGVAMQRRFAERERERMRKQAVGMAEKLGIGMEVLDSSEGLEGAKQKAKGWYDVRTGRIVLVLPNHKSTADVMETVLHEAVAHYGLRRLFGEHFDDFLDNVFANAEPAVRREIADLAARHGWNVRVATEEYLASLAERTDFERAEKSGWMRQVRDFFMRMLAKAGIILPRPLGVNELRYILWRSYENLAHPGRFESPIGEAEDIARQYELKAGNYREEPRGDERAAEGEVRFRGPEAEEIQRELDNFISKVKNAPSIHLVEGEESIDKLPIHPYFKRRIKEELDSPFFKGCYIEQDGAVVVIADRISSVKDLRATLSHESCHHASRSLMLTDKMKRAALKYLEEKYPKKYDELTSDYDESHWCEEALAKLFEIKSDEYGLDKLLSSKFAGNNEIAKLFTQITNFLNYEQRGKTVRDRLGRSGYNAGTDSRREEDSKGDSKNQGESRAGYLGNRRENQAGRAGEAGIYARIDSSKGLSSTPYRRALAAQQYEKRMASGFYQAQEALQDSMLSLRDAMLGILKAEGRGKMYIEDVDGFENAYLGENRLSSVNQAECELFATQLFRPLLEEFERIAGTEQEQNRLREYMMAKHGLERNAVMRQREQDELMARAQEAFAAYKKDHPKGKQVLDDFVGELKMRDYAGLTGLMLEDDVLKAEEQARELVERYEKEHDTGELWKRTRAVNQAILKKHLDGGLLSQKDYEKISQMYEYYIPLRGFKEQTSDEAYAYLTHRESAFNAPIRKAEGRTSVADDPIATMQSMAESGILQANRNVLVKQKFLNFAMNHPSDLVSVSDLWIAYDEVKDEWVPQFPDDIQEDDTPEEVSRKMDAFEERMKELAEKNPDKYKHGKEAVNIPYRVVNEQGKRQHQVVVKRGGRDYVVTVNGNPRLAQALNGESNPDNDMKGYIGKVMKGVDKVNRRLSVYYTTMNPDFVASNFVRDMLFANTMVWVKESPRYAAQFHANFGKSNPVMMFSLLRKYRSGKLDESVAVEREFKEFMMNGGETGYAVLKKMEERKRDIEKELRKLGATIPVGLAMDELKRYLEDVNRAVELCARFAAYRTSRKMGRSVSRSIYDAKEISVNFNKKGSGSKFMDENGQTRLGSMAGFLSDLGRHSYVFWNAGVQGTFGNFGKQVIRHPVKSTLMTMATMFAIGALMAGMGGGGDDEGELGYYDLPEGVRRSNIVFPIGADKFCTLPLPVEFRTFYGLGELMMSVLGGHQKMDGGELGMAIAGQLTQLLPLNVLEGGNFAGNLVLSAGRPLVDAYILNRSWTGMPIAKDTPYNQYEPEWRRVYKSTSSQLVDLSRWMNEMSGGGDHEKGFVDWNPAKLEYVLRQYLGGMYGFADRLVKTGEMALGQREWSANEMPLVNRLVRTADERTRFRAVNSLYYEYKDERDETRYRLRRYEEDMEMGRGDYSREIESIYGSPEYRRMVVFDEYDPSIREIERMKKETTDERVIEELTEQQNELKRELVKELREDE